MNGIRLTQVVSSSLSALVVLAACSQDPAPAAREKPAAAPLRVAAPTATATATAPTRALPGGSAANTIFKTRCMVCHGESGQGNGPGAAALKVKPRNYTDGNWQKSVTDEHIAEIVVKGGGAVGKDPGMPANPDLKDKPEVVADLVKIVRSFAPKDEPSAADGGGAKPQAAVQKPAKAKAK